MTRLFAGLRKTGTRKTGALRHAPPHARGDAAARRLTDARRTFDLSVVALRKAALDHVDLQDLASIALRANLNRLAERLAADA